MVCVQLDKSFDPSPSSPITITGPDQKSSFGFVVGLLFFQPGWSIHPWGFQLHMELFQSLFKLFLVPGKVGSYRIVEQDKLIVKNFYLRRNKRFVNHLVHYSSRFTNIYKSDR